MYGFGLADCRFGKVLSATWLALAAAAWLAAPAAASSLGVVTGPTIRPSREESS